MFKVTDNSAKLREQQTANECELPIAELAIRSMRSKLGRSGIASHYDKLSKDQKLVLLYCAGINANLLWDYRFEQFSRNQRNEIRHAIIEITNLAHAFEGINLSKEQCYFQPTINSSFKNVSSRLIKSSSG